MNLEPVRVTEDRGVSFVLACLFWESAERGCVYVGVFESVLCFVSLVSGYEQCLLGNTTTACRMMSGL